VGGLRAGSLLRLLRGCGSVVMQPFSAILVIYDEEMDATVNDHLARKRPETAQLRTPLNYYYDSYERGSHRSALRPFWRHPRWHLP
jgi:hypothetical protein